jgi:O-antigen/teichoic acid export membrane protein
VVHGDLGASALGRYSVARNVGGFVLVLLQLVNFVWMPRLFGIKDDESRRKVLARSRDGIYMLAVLFAIAVATSSPALLRLWAPPSYHPQSLLLVTALIASAGLLLADAMIYSQVMILSGRTKAVAVGAALAAVLNLGLNLILVPILGIDGSAGVTCFCYGFDCLWLRRLAGAAGPATNLRPLIYAIAGEAVCLGSAAAPPNGVSLAFRLLVAAAATIAFFLQLLALIRPETYQALRARFIAGASRGGGQPV